MEKLFFSITRWLMLVGATIAFFFLIGGGIYAFKLYQTSKDTEFRGTVYQPQNPKVSFEVYEKMQKEKIEKLRQQKEQIKQYVHKIIKNGSSGHGFKMESMPSNLIKGQNAINIAEYVANKLEGDKPLSFGACIACHGEDGKGMQGASPDLLKLPIYYGYARKKQEGVSYAPSDTQNNIQYTDPLKQYSAKLASIINRYAIEAGQKGTTVDEFYKFMKEVKHKYSEENFVLFKEQLLNGLNSLLQYGKSMKNTQKNVDEMIQWEEYISWFLKDFDAQVAQENKKYHQSLNQLQQAKNAKENQALEAKVELLQLLTALGTALIAFILLTMILVLFKIEANTRKETIEKKA